MFQKQKSIIHNLKSNRSAFTIVELLVVIIVIGVLAAIVTVAYSGVREKAIAASLQSDLRNAATQLEIYKTTSPTNSYPTTLNDLNNGQGFTPSGDNALDYFYNPDTGIYGMTVNNSNVSYYVDSNNTGPVRQLSFAMSWGGNDWDEGHSVKRTADGGYVVTGVTYSYGTGSSDMFISKYESDGTLSWSKTWGGSGNDNGNSVFQTTDGGYVVTGSTFSYGSGGENLFLAKYESNGTLSWSKTWGGTSSDRGVSVVQSDDGGYVVIGNTGYGVAAMDVLMLKFTSDGNVSWSKTWGSSGFGYNYGRSVIQTSDNDYVATGYVGSFGAGGVDMFLAKYTSDGSLVWIKTWGGPDSDYGESVIQTSDNGYIVTGQTNSYGAGQGDVFIVKYDSNGVLIWNKVWGGGDTEGGLSVTQSIDGGYLVVGDTYSYGAGSEDVLFVKYSSDGTVDWTGTFGGVGYDCGYSVVQANDGGYVVNGSTEMYNGGDMFVAKLLSDGIMINCSSPMCQRPTTIVTSPSATVTSPSATVSSPTGTVTSPTATVTSPSATATVIVAP